MNKPLSADQVRAMFNAIDEANTKRAWNEAERERLAKLKAVRDEVKEAFADCWLPWEEGSQRRNLEFLATEAVTPTEAVEIMREATPDGYNEFDADLLALFPDTCRIRLAREASVAVYVTGEGRDDPEVAQLLRCDYYKDDGDKLHIWWD